MTLDEATKQMKDKFLMADYRLSNTNRLLTDEQYQEMVKKYDQADKS